MVPGHGSFPYLSSRLVGVCWPTCNIMQPESRSPPPMVLHFSVERGPILAGASDKEITGAWVIHHGRKLVLDANGSAEFPAIDLEFES